MENPNGLVRDACRTHACGKAERDGALVMLERRPRLKPVTLGADIGYGTAACVTALYTRRFTPHVASNRRVSKHGVIRHSKIDPSTIRHKG